MNMIKYPKKNPEKNEKKNQQQKQNKHKNKTNNDTCLYVKLRAQLSMTSRNPQSGQERDKWLIHGTWHHKDSQLPSQKNPCRILQVLV